MPFRNVLRGHSPLTAVIFARSAAFYLLAMFVTTFVNVAFYHEIMRSMMGERASLRTGLGFAAGRLSAIVAWTLFASSVGLLLQLAASRLSWLGRFGLLLIGLSWSAAATFVIPVIIREDRSNPFRLLKASASTVKKTWGESVYGFVEIQSGVVVLVMVLFVISSWRTAGETGSGLLLLSGATIAVLVFWAAFANSARAVYRCALYVYATEGVVPEPYSAELMDSAWSVRKPR
jgi:hypothetical protein